MLRTKPSHVTVHAENVNRLGLGAVICNVGMHGLERSCESRQDGIAARC